MSVKLLTFISKTENKVGNDIGKHKVPRYLYHITNKAAYESMLADGCLRTTKDSYKTNFNGVFMTELRNFTKRWNSAKQWSEDFLSNTIFSRAVDDNQEIVMLRIPTKDLNKSKLKIRSQNRLMKAEGAKKVIQDDSHLMNGDAAIMQSLYTKRKEALEYIYPINISMRFVEYVGKAKVNIMEAWKCKLKPKEVLAQIFRGTPEEKCINKLK